MLTEIGSEFWYVEQGGYYNIEITRNKLFMLSGRTALDFIIHDIKADKLLNSVYLPSYCCYTIILPFIRNNIKVFFYDVYLNESGGFSFDIDFNFVCDVVFLIQYFGNHDLQVESIAKSFKDRGVTIIEDITHSFFNNIPYSRYADYVFGSLRKWTGLYSGGYVLKTNGDFLIKAPEQSNENYYKLRMRAVELKRNYMEKGLDTKVNYLNIFNKSEEYLENNYCNYLIDDISLEKFNKINILLLKQKRQQNARLILEAIEKIEFIKPVYYIISNEDTPFFVPVVIKYNKRDEIKNLLIQSGIYCPVHWPISELHNISSKAFEIYNSILSFVCDQRYGMNEMQYFIEKLYELKV